MSGIEFTSAADCSARGRSKLIGSNKGCNHEKIHMGQTINDMGNRKTSKRFFCLDAGKKIVKASKRLKRDLRRLQGHKVAKAKKAKNVRTVSSVAFFGGFL